jgi:hypothetical protein
VSKIRAHDRLVNRLTLMGLSQESAKRTAEEILGEHREEMARLAYTFKNPAPQGSEHYRSGWDDAIDTIFDAITMKTPPEQDGEHCFCGAAMEDHHLALHDFEADTGESPFSTWDRKAEDAWQISMHRLGSAGPCKTAVPGAPPCKLWDGHQGDHIA